MTQETALGAALKSAVQTMSKKKQTDMIADHIYNKYDVFKRFKPLAVGIDQDLITALPQFDPTLIARVLANHCRRPRYLKALARGGKRFDLNNRFKGEVTPEEQAIAQQHPSMQQAQAAQAERQAAAKAAPASTKATRQDMQQLVKLLDGLAVSERPARKDMLVALLQNHLGETSVQSLRVAHALAQLQALKRVTVKKDVVSYPSPERAPAPAKKAADPAVSKVAAPKPTAAKVAQAVLASLQKMPKNKPTRVTGLLKFIETHAAKAGDPQSMARQVCALLEARQQVALSPDGKGVTYPGLKAKRAASA